MRKSDLNIFVFHSSSNQFSQFQSHHLYFSGEKLQLVIKATSINATLQIQQQASITKSQIYSATRSWWRMIEINQPTPSCNDTVSIIHLIAHWYVQYKQHEIECALKCYGIKELKRHMMNRVLYNVT